MPRKSLPEVRVTLRGGPFTGVDARVVRRRANKMLAHLALTDVALSIALLDDSAMHELNHSYRQKDRPTDVLAFAMRESAASSPTQHDAPRDESGREMLGDVVISVDTARRQAARRRRPLLDELTMLLAHGLLHLLGYDHDTKKKETVMLAKTAELESAANKRERPTAN